MCEHIFKRSRDQSYYCIKCGIVIKNIILKKKLKTILRREMKKVPTDKQVQLMDIVYASSYAQAKFNTLMDLDRELKIGAFYKI